VQQIYFNVSIQYHLAESAKELSQPHSNQQHPNCVINKNYSMNENTDHIVWWNTASHNHGLQDM